MMRSAKILALSSIFLGALAASASAVVTGQLFYFEDPVVGAVTSTNAQFHTNFGSLAGTFSHIGSADNHITLKTVNYNAGLVGTPQTSKLDVVYYLASYTASTNADFGADITLPATYANNDEFTEGGGAVIDSGLLTFIDPNNSNQILLQIGFTQSGVGNGGFGAAVSDGPIFLGGSLLSGDLTDHETGADFSFGFAGTLAGMLNEKDRSSTFTASLGNAPDSVPEPSAFVALGLGGLAVLRRRRRA